MVLIYKLVALPTARDVENEVDEVWKLVGEYPDRDSLKAMGQGGEYAVLESTGERDDGLPTGFELSEVRPVSVDTSAPTVTLGRKRKL